MGKDRILSLDIFRGMTIALMIVVNTGGAGASPYPPLVHADWFGFTLADLVYPSFLFAMGNAMAIVLDRPMQTGPYFRKVAKRTIELFLLGYLMYWYPFVHYDAAGTLAFNPIATTRIMGVLQRIAVCYGLAAVIVRFVPVKRIAPVCLAILMAYWALLAFGAPPGLAYDKFGNLGMVIDRIVLGANHMLTWDEGFEPEGLLGCLPATVNVLGGYLIGRRLLRKTQNHLTPILVASAVLIAAALVWNQWFPLSKKLWTGSFVLLTVGIDGIWLAALAAAYDLKKYRFAVKFFSTFGRHPLTIYLFSELLLPTLALTKPLFGTDPYAWVGIEIFQRLAPGPFGSLLCAVCFTLGCWLFGRLLLERKPPLRA